jgi:hypothetical protein
MPPLMLVLLPRMWGSHSLPDLCAPWQCHYLSIAPPDPCRILGKWALSSLCGADEAPINSASEADTVVASYCLHFKIKKVRKLKKKRRN